MRKILIISESLKVGGAEKSLVSMLKMMDYNRFDVTLMLITRKGDFLNEVETIPGLKIRWCFSPSSCPAHIFWGKFKYKLMSSWISPRIVGYYLCRRYDIAVAFCEGQLTKWVANAYSSCMKIAWVHTDMINNDWPVKIGVFKSFKEEYEAYQRFDKVIGVSEIVTKGMIKRFGCRNIQTIYNIIDGQIIIKGRENQNKKIDNSSCKIISVGRLEEVKGYDRLIEAMKIIVRQRERDVSLTLVGDGSQRKKLEQKVLDYGLSNIITFEGQQVNPYKYMAGSDIFICPSREEGFNIAIVEAMILGLPVVATNCAGPLEILGDSEYGVVVDNSIEGIVEGIIKLYNNRELITYYKAQSLKRCKDFSPEKQLAQIENLFCS